MRRYAVRFLVAILTFGIGVALSLVLGLFKPQQITVQTWGRRSCSKEFRYVRPPFLTIDSNPDSPLKLVYRGTTSNSAYDREQMQLSIENRSGRRVSQYAISGEKIWKTSEKTSNNFFDRSFDEVLDPGESRLITLPLNTEGMSFHVAVVKFEDGSTWAESRDARQ